ncbi:MAG TPA: cytochrome c biogenesis protein CcdA [Candidatus Binataceae bacterium]
MIPDSISEFTFNSMTRAMREPAPRKLIRVPLNIATIAIAAMMLALAATIALPAWAASPGQIVGIRSITLERPLEPGASSVLKVDALVLAGWHINSNHPLSEDYIPTVLRVSAPGGIAAGAIKYPEAKEIKPDFSGGEKLSVFGGAIAFEVPLAVAPDFRTGPGHNLTVTIDYQPCNDNMCLKPASVSSTVDLGTLAASDGRGSGVLGGAVASATASGAGLAGNDAGETLARVFAKHGLFLGFLAVLLGGMALNLTPCVYPLVGVTIAYFGRQGGGPRNIWVLAICYVLGIALMFSAVGVAVALSGGIFGAALQNPLVLVAIAAVMVTLAASCFGMFTIQPPQFMMQWAGAARPGYAGSMLMGLGMGVVAAPCIGPIVLGLLLMVERSQSALFGFALFFTLAIGLGLPYIGLALAAGSIRSLPRSGEWLAWVEQLFGFVLIGLAIYFLDPVLPNHLMTRMLPYYGAMAAIYLGFITAVGRNWRPFLIFRWALGAAAVLALIYMTTARRTPERTLEFEAFNPARLDSAASKGKPVLVDFSADWCIPCREMEHSTFVDPSVVREAARFVRLRANLTAQDKANEALISKYSIQGVPTTMLIDSRGRVFERKVGYIGATELLADLHRVD